MAQNHRHEIYVLLTVFVLSAVDLGCKSRSDPAQPTVVTIRSGELNPNGTFNDAAMQKIEAQSSAPSLMVVVYRGSLSDAGLLQLTKFSHLTKVQAPGSTITSAGIDKLKAVIPQVEVSK